MAVVVAGALCVTMGPRLPAGLQEDWRGQGERRMGSALPWAILVVPWLPAFSIDFDPVKHVKWSSLCHAGVQVFQGSGTGSDSHGHRQGEDRCPQHTGHF
jgi:hypothetical protein